MKYILATLFLLFCEMHLEAQSSDNSRSSKLRVDANSRYVHISNINPAYFSLGDGTTYIPTGINMINPSGRNSRNPDSAFAEIEDWMKNLSLNGGNYIRIWLSQAFWDVEEAAGNYDEQKARRIDRFIELARKYHLRIKLTLEHFRSITVEENPQEWATKFAYHKSQGGPLDSIGEYISTDRGRQLFLNKVDYYKKRYGSDTLFFGWELWNEMNAMKGPEDSLFYDWNISMLAAVKQQFPEHLVMQSLGSFDGEYAKPLYRKMMSLPGNEVAQVHRYLDLGAEMDVCHAPMDVICASAVKDLQAYNLGKPIILAETGAVEPDHAGPSKYYEKDTAGTLLHDILFATFFSGAAGPGMSWHWESYVHKNKLWYHFGRFNEAIRGLDPVTDSVVAHQSESELFRIYTLRGKRKNLIWIRDKNNNWKTELENGIRPALLSGKTLTLTDLPKDTAVEVYDPWTNKWSAIKSKGGSLNLPPFRRSLVIRFGTTAAAR